MPLGRAEIGEFAVEGPCDDTAHSVLPPEDAAGGLADAVELGHRHDGLVRGDLENAVGRRIDDGVSGLQVFLAEFVQDGCAAGRFVADDAGADGRTA